MFVLLILLLAQVVNRPAIKLAEYAGTNQVHATVQKRDTNDSASHPTANTTSLSDGGNQYNTTYTQQPADSKGYLPEIINGALVFITMIIAGVGIRQYVVSRQSSEKQLRAYLAIEIFPIRFEPDVPYPIFSVKNYGQTPAYNFELWTKSGIAPPDVREFDVTAPSEAINRHAYMPPTRSAEQLGFTFHDMNRGLNDSQVEEFKSGKIRFYCYGVATYEDIFEKMQRLPFSFAFHAAQVFENPGEPDSYAPIPLNCPRPT